MSRSRLLLNGGPRSRRDRFFGGIGTALRRSGCLAILGGWASLLHAAAPLTGVIHYQGRVLVGTGAFDGTGQFKFQLVNGAGTQTFWRNSPDANSNGEPDQAVVVPVNRGLYGVDLGDPATSNMAPIPLSVFTDKINGLAGDPMFLRVWFNDGLSGFQRLTPDQRISAVSFAMAAASVPDGSITSAKLAAGAVTSASFTGTLLPAQIPNLDAVKIASGVLDAARLPSNVALKNPDLQNATAALNAQISLLQTQVNELKSQIGTGGGGVLPPGLVQVSLLPADAALLGLGYTRFAGFPAASWITSNADGGPSPRFELAAVWTASFNQLFVWGGQVGAGIYSGTGGLYRPATDVWQNIPSADAPSARRGHSMVWDGTNEAIVWGGFSEDGYLNTGARFNLAQFAWKPIATANAPSRRESHVAIQAGPFMAIWGGRNINGKLGGGGIYHNVSNTWNQLPLAGAPVARSDAAAVWTGSRILIWGGASATGPEQTGGQLLFQTGAPFAPTEWRAISTLNAPGPRLGHSAIWTGTRLIVWGGRNGSAALGDGASYNPISDAWTALSAVDAPSPRANHTAVWTGAEMIVFGGETATGETASGAAFDPTANRWRSLSVLGSPVARSGAVGIWSGTELIIFGGKAGPQPVGALQRLDPQPATHLYRKL